MLNQVVKITLYNSKGRPIKEAQFTDVQFTKNGAMAVLPSKTFREFMKEVDKGGAIFIERIWVT